MNRTYVKPEKKNYYRTIKQKPKKRQVYSKRSSEDNGTGIFGGNGSCGFNENINSINSRRLLQKSPLKGQYGVSGTMEKRSPVVIKPKSNHLKYYSTGHS
jgi:hypothetical protein